MNPIGKYDDFKLLIKNYAIINKFYLLNSQNHQYFKPRIPENIYLLRDSFPHSIFEYWYNQTKFDWINFIQIVQIDC